AVSVTEGQATLPEPADAVDEPEASQDLEHEEDPTLLRADPEPEEPSIHAELEAPKIPDFREFEHRPSTPEHILSKPEYDGTGWGEPDEYDEPGTPESVIHHPVSDDDDDD